MLACINWHIRSKPTLRTEHVDEILGPPVPTSATRMKSGAGRWQPSKLRERRFQVLLNLIDCVIEVDPKELALLILSLALEALMHASLHDIRICG